MNKKSSLISEIIFFGALWGILEATIGYVWHLLPSLVAGLIMFPIGSFLLVRAYLKTGSRTAMIYIGLIAAAIKALNLFMPYAMLVKIVDPMVCIVLESLVVFAIAPLLASKPLANRLAAMPIASLSWRGAFVLFLVFQDLVFGTVSGQLQSLQAGFVFIVLNGLFESLFASGLLFLNLLIAKRPDWKPSIRPLLAAGTLVLATVLTILL